MGTFRKHLRKFDVKLFINLLFVNRRDEKRNCGPFEAWVEENRESARRGI